MAARRERGLLDPEPAAGESIFDHRIFVIASDGDLQEGVSNEACSIAGTQRLSELIVIHDSNKISIEDDTNIAFTEDVSMRYKALGWHVQTVDWITGDGTYQENLVSLAAAIENAKGVTDQPSFIDLRTIIGWPAPDKMGTGDAHGSALGDDEVAATKRALGMDPDQKFEVSEALLSHTREVAQRGHQDHEEWNQQFAKWRTANPSGAKLLDRMQKRELPSGWEQALPTFDADPKGIATRAASGKVLTALAPVLPELWGGSADLAGSNNTTMDGEPSFLPADRQSKKFPGGLYGRTLHFGIREHAMGMILNGIALHGGTRPYGGTFLTFSDYMRGAVRLAALQQLPVTYVWTHDSIGLGEDGPTHQPIEHLAALRAMPGLDVVRPGDANEVAAAWQAILNNTDRPAALVLSRQAMPTLDRSVVASASGVAQGGYILKDAPEGQPEVILIGTGSELHLAVTAAEQLLSEGIQARVVSMPCIEWYHAQSMEYRELVLPGQIRARVSVEAGVAQSWYQLIGDAGRAISIEHFGASASAEVLFKEFGFTVAKTIEAAKDSIAATKSPPVVGTNRIINSPASATRTSTN